MEDNDIVSNPDREEVKLILGEVKELTRKIFEHFKSREQTHGHTVTILGYTVELLLYSLSHDSMEYEQLSRDFRSFVKIVHRDVQQRANELNEMYS